MPGVGKPNVSELFLPSPPDTAFSLGNENNFISRLNCAFEERMWRQEE